MDLNNVTPLGPVTYDDPWNWVVIHLDNVLSVIRDQTRYYDVIMSAMASKINSLTIVYSRFYSRGSEKNSKLRVTGLCAGNSPATGEFPAKGPVTRKMLPFDDVIMNWLNQP